MIWYVSSKSGNDGNEGHTSSAALKTLQRAIECASSGDTIVLAPGLYDQELPARISRARGAGLIVSVSGADS